MEYKRESSKWKNHFSSRDNKLKALSSYIFYAALWEKCYISSVRAKSMFTHSNSGALNGFCVFIHVMSSVCNFISSERRFFSFFLQALFLSDWKLIFSETLELERSEGIIKEKLGMICK